MNFFIYHFYKQIPDNSARHIQHQVINITAAEKSEKLYHFNYHYGDDYCDNVFCEAVQFAENTGQKSQGNKHNNIAYEVLEGVPSHISA